MTKSKKLVAFVIFPLLFLSLLVLLPVMSVLVNSHTTQDRYTVNPEGHLAVDIELGAIIIETTDRNYVDIVTRKQWKSKSGILEPKLGKRAAELIEDFEITIECDDPDTPSNIRIDGKFNRGREYWQEALKWLTVEIQVTVPRQYNVTLKTASHGDIHVGDLMGAVRTEALGGNLHLGEIQGEVWGTTGVNGEIILKGCQSRVNLTVAMGNIRAEMTAQPQNPWTLHASMGGEIDVTLLPDIAINIDAQTQGKISSDPSIQLQGDIKENRLEGILNGGGPLLKLRSSAGAIRLKRK